MNKQIAIAALAGLFSLGAFAQTHVPLQEQSAARVDADSSMTHHHKHHKHHKHPTSAAVDAPAMKP
ncbi:MAG: hypothetical protein RXR20_07735 [Paraburkholderia sp.]|uniref:hypothetical protein n=1 Tax=Burkholderiaceae TaxID=119060 RepID=UPI0010F649A7|nr:hypothetical protein [Burkholderia sp. 4M9327F10]